MYRCSLDMLQQSHVQVLDVVPISLCHWRSSAFWISCNFSQLTAIFCLLLFVIFLTVKYLTAQFHESASGLRSCWLLSSKLVSVFIHLAKGVGHGTKCTAQCAGCRRRRLISSICWQEESLAPKSLSFVKSHIWSFPRCTDGWTCAALTVKRADKKALLHACLPESN